MQAIDAHGKQPLSEGTSDGCHFRLHSHCTLIPEQCLSYTHAYLLHRESLTACYCLVCILFFVPDLMFHNAAYSNASLVAS